MELIITILLIFIGIYWYYCLFWNINIIPNSNTASDYFIANRSIPYWWFIFAATSTILGSWTFISHPGMIFANGFQASFISFYAIAIPFTGILFFKRQWILGKRFDFITPGDMFAAYFKSANLSSNRFFQMDGVRLLVVIVAFLFSIFYIAIQLRASGYLISTLTQGRLPEIISMWILAIVLLSYVVPQGLLRVAYIDRMQLLLLASGIVAIGSLVFYQVGGWFGLKEGIIHLANYDYHRAPHTAEYSHYLAIPGMIQTDVWNFKTDTQADGWTGMMLLTFMLALMGIQASPAFTMWAFSNKNPKPFAPQQVLASALVIGFILLIFTTIQGVGAHLLGANPEFTQAHPQIATSQVEPLPGGVTDRLVPNIILSFTTIIESPPWHIKLMVGLLIALLAIAALAAMQSTASSYILTSGAILTRDLLGHRDPKKEPEQINWGRGLAILVVLVALILASLFKGPAVALLGGLAVAYGLQMWPALVGICWWPFLTRQGIIWGLTTGLIVVTVTENPFSIFGSDWMRWPLTIHSAAWGLLANFVVAFLVSCGTQNQKEINNRMYYHRLLKRYAALPEHKIPWKPFAWVFTLTWFIFAVGPGAVIGNDFFGNPNDPNTWWLFGLVPIWGWQVVWWALGVGMMWFLAYFMEMSTMSDDKIALLEQEVKESQEIQPEVQARAT